MNKELKVACNMNLPVTLKEWVLARSKQKNSSFTGEVTYLLSEMKRQIEAEKESFSEVKTDQEKTENITPVEVSVDVEEIAESTGTELAPVEKSEPKKVNKVKKIKKKAKQEEKQEGFLDWLLG